MIIFKKLKDLTLEEIQRIRNYENYRKFHGRPVTRREFLASGLKAGAAAMVLPTIWEILSRSGYSAAGTGCGGATLPAFMSLNLSGGASMAGNAFPKDISGAFLPNYTGVGIASAGNAVKLFGPSGPDVDGTRGIFGATGIQSTASPQTLANTTMVTFSAVGQDDTADNPIDPTPMVTRIKKGKFLPALGKNRNKPAVLPKVPALQVSSVTDIVNSVALQGTIGAMDAADKSKIFSMISGLSEIQTRKLASATGPTGGEVLRDLVVEATGMNVTLVGGSTTGIDPRSDAKVTGANIWNLNNTGEARDAAVVYNTLKGNASIGYLEMGGYDYHGQGRNNQDTMDASAGAKIGQILETARVLGVKMVLTVTTDGGIGHDTSLAPTSDRGENGMSYMFFYDPQKRPSQSGAQVGSFTFSGSQIGVNRTTEIGSSPERAITAMVANYCAFGGQPGLIDSVAPRVFAANEIDAILKVSS